MTGNPTKAQRAELLIKRLKRRTGDACHAPKKPKVAYGEKARRINSRKKGAIGELEFAALLNSYELQARRGQQYSGGSNSPDVICEQLTNIHFEVKRTQVCPIYRFMEQAEKDGKSKLPIVAYRKNNEKWLAIIDMDEMIKLLLIREGAYL